MVNQSPFARCTKCHLHDLGKNTRVFARYMEQKMCKRRVQITEPGLIGLTDFTGDEMVLVNDPIFSRQQEKLFVNMKRNHQNSKADQQSRSSRLTLHRRQETLGKEIASSIQFVMAIMIWRNARGKQCKTEVRHCSGRSYAMNVLAIFPKNTMQKVAPVEGYAIFAVKNIHSIT